MYKAKIAKKHRDGIANLILEIQCGYISQGMNDRGTIGYDRGMRNRLMAEKRLVEDYGIGEFDKASQDLLDILQRRVEDDWEQRKAIRAEQSWYEDGAMGPQEGF